MKSHLITALLVICAIPMYLSGFAGAGVAFIAAGVVLEMLFWMRIVRGRRGNTA